MIFEFRFLGWRTGLSKATHVKSLIVWGWAVRGSIPCVLHQTPNWLWSATLSMILSTFSVIFKYCFWCGFCFLCLPWLLQPQLLPLDRQWFSNISVKCVLSYGGTRSVVESWDGYHAAREFPSSLQFGTYASIWTWQFRKKRVSWIGRHWWRTWSRNSWVRSGMWRNLHLLLLAVLAWLPLWLPLWTSRTASRYLGRWATHFWRLSNRYP